MGGKEQGAGLNGRGVVPGGPVEEADACWCCLDVHYHGQNKKRRMGEGASYG